MKPRRPPARPGCATREDLHYIPAQLAELLAAMTHHDRTAASGLDDSMAPHTPAGGLWAEAFRVERRGVDLRAGLAGAVASCAPLALGVAAGEPEIAVAACFGGLNAALGVPRGVLRERLGWGAGASLACCVSVALATAVQASVAGSVAVAFAWIGLTAFLRTFGHNGGLTGFVIGAIFVITNGLPAESLDLGTRVLWFALGSVAGVGLMVAAYARDAPAPRRAATPLATVLARGARQLRDALVGNALLRAHALRLASIVAATTLAYRLLDLEHGYWVPLTVLAVLQPEEHASDVRAVQRATGTLVGTAVIALVMIATGEEWLMVAAQGVAAFGLFALSSRGYFWLVMLLTPTALLTISAVDYQGVAVALERAAWSALGIVLGLAVAELFWRLPQHRPRVASS
jgi:Fusaric acid resistance protein-like